MLVLKDFLKKGEAEKSAIGHFNFAELTVLKAAAGAAAKLNVPVIVGTSESERAFFGPKLAVRMVRWLREESGLPIFINADHTKSFGKVKEAVEAGYDAILFDGSDLPFEENVRQTKKVVAYVKSKSPKILVEGEIGYIGSSSKIHEKIPKGAAVEKEQLTTPEEASRFVEETGVDMLAPAVGTIHGIVKGYLPKIDTEKITKLKKTVTVPLVLHGASGSSSRDIAGAIKAGINIVHISTDIRLAWRRAVDKSLKDKKELAPYRLLQEPFSAAEKIIEKYLRLFNRR